MSKHEPDSSTTNYSGYVFGNYRLIEKLGQGGNAAVYLGEHRYLGTLAAVKLQRSFEEDSENEQLLAEARVAAHLIHPRIIRVLEFGQQGELFFLVMDYAPNGTLRQYYPPGTRIPPARVIEMLWQITSSLCYIHECGQVHRDLKPANVLIGRDHELLLSDFGLTIGAYAAKASGQQLRSGTIAYMSPEQIDGYPCQASDQYALGVMVYEWLSGVLPFRGTPASIINKHLYELPPSLCQQNPLIPQAVEYVVFRALAKDPEKRYPSVEEFAEALEEAFAFSSPLELTGPDEYAFDAPIADQPGQIAEPEAQNTWRDICILFSSSLLIGTALGVVLYVLGIPLQLMWFVFVLCIVLVPLAGALFERSYPTFFLTASMVILAAIPAVAAHSLVPFVSIYLVLLLVSLLLALTARLHGY